MDQYLTSGQLKLRLTLSKVRECDNVSACSAIASLTCPAMIEVRMLFLAIRKPASSEDTYYSDAMNIEIEIILSNGH
jgi:hypothetical protein